MMTTVIFVMTGGLLDHTTADNLTFSRLWGMSSCLLRTRRDNGQTDQMGPP